MSNASSAIKEKPDLAEQMRRLGYVVIPGVLDAAEVAHYRECSDRIIATLDRDHLDRNKTTGTMVHSNQMPDFAPLFAHPRALAAMQSAGLADPRFLRANLISKPPDGPRLFWHQDGLYWDEAAAYRVEPIQVFAMWYLVDTSRHNGCLRALPGSHLYRHPLHDVGVAHDPKLRADVSDDPRFGDVEGEVDVPVKAGDLVIGDARMFHAAHDNQSQQWRTVITIWYLPNFQRLSEAGQCRSAEVAREAHKTWPADARAIIEPIRCTYNGPLNAATLPKPSAELSRTPDQCLPAKR